ncbi:MAG: SDR family NAD(P)-dependent oxidoreductase [Nocardioidaceae bacterium]
MRRRVLVTGGASGLGLALVSRFAAAGDRVLATDLAPAIDGPLFDLVGTTRGVVHYRPLAVRSDDDWAAARDWVDAEWGGLDVLVNNAGVAGGGRIELCDLDEWQWITDINLFGVVRGTRAFVPMMKQAGTGRIVNVASLAGLVHPPGMGSYNAVKAAVVAFTETCGHELAPYGVGCSVVCPSYFRTNLMASMQGNDTDLAQKMAHLVESSQLSADEIAAAVVDGIEHGVELIVPDEPARAAYALKQTDRAAYDAQLRSTAARAKDRAKDRSRDRAGS